VTDPPDDSASRGQLPTESDDAVEPGAIIRSPSPTADATAEQRDSEVRWPWEVGPNGEKAEAQAQIPAGPTVPTEKLYRSSGYADPTVGDDPRAGTTTSALAAVSSEAAARATDNPQPPGERIQDMAEPAQSAVLGSPQAQRAPEKGLSTVPVFLIIFGMTTIVGLVDMYLNRQFTYLTGGAFVIASAIGAILVRPRDIWTAVISPPIAFLLALIVSGQPTTIGDTGQLLLREASLIATGLAFNAPYVFGGTILALIIVLIRRVNLRHS
jgi:hypothetical protein